MTVYPNLRTNQPVSWVGLAYATLWTIVIGARAAFSYSSTHWFSHSLGTWMTQHSVTSNWSETDRSISQQRPVGQLLQR